MQYFQPKPGYFVGDCMPFSHDGIFHLFYLLDEGHHKGRGGLGGHQWAHCSTRDLVNWTHHPLAIPSEEDWEGSICTGSTFYDNGLYHAFYATRKPDYTQHLSHATSSDGINFKKISPNPFASAPGGFSPKDCRDPFVFKDAKGIYNMLVTSRIEDYPLHDRGGCLIRYTSKDLDSWNFEGIFLVPGDGTGYGCIPECPDYFFWKGWYYLLFGIGLQTFYRMSRKPLGPWIRPKVDVLDGHLNAVMKTASFGKDRRIGVGWIGPRKDNKDSEWMLWGGQTVFREIIQNKDGTIGAKFLEEMAPAGKTFKTSFRPLTSGAKGNSSSVIIDSMNGMEAGAFENLPPEYSFECTVRPSAKAHSFGLGLRGSGRYEKKFDLVFERRWNSISLGNETLLSTTDLGKSFKLESVVRGSIIDICINGRQCLINRCHELDGKSLFLFCNGGKVNFDNISFLSLE